MVQVRDLKDPLRMRVVRCGASKREALLEGRQMSVPGVVVRVKWAMSTVVLVECVRVVWVKVWQGMVVLSVDVQWRCYFDLPGV